MTHRHWNGGVFDMTQYRGRIRSVAPTVQSDRSIHTSLAELKYVFTPSLVAQETETLLAQERTIRVGPMPLTPVAATGTHLLGPDEGRRQ
ncbi:MAG: hypothetical protein OXU81_17620 [Gammaproteobacteria bacterium]|nr:hypothetical protein [Gammaproteobacteria bacterium]